VSGPNVLGGDLGEALEAISVPSYIVDTSGVIRWVNAAGMAIVGDVRGRQITSVVAPEETLRARESHARKVIGRERVTDTSVAIMSAEGRRVRVDISAVPLKSGHTIVGVFGQVSAVPEPDERPPLPALTPRQSEVLRLLEHGKSTEQIADHLSLSQETVRNHIRRLLSALGVHTRLEAVARARLGPVERERIRHEIGRVA
jgi:PAS domain S-box-containing protein